MSSVSTEIDLDLIRRRPNTIGKNIYSVIFESTSWSDLGRKLCCIKGGWGKGGSKNCKQYEGVAAKWIRDLDKSGKKSRPTLIELDGEKKIVKAVKILKFHSNYYNSDLFGVKELRESLLDEDVSQNCVGVTDFDYQYIGLDDFGNEAIIAKVVEEAFGNSRWSQLYNRIEFAGVCGDYGLLLMEYSKYGDVYSFCQSTPGKFMGEGIIKPMVTLSIIQQVATALKFLQSEIQFIHSDLKVQNVLLTSGKPGKGLINQNIIAKIADYANCSATVKSLNDNKILSKDIRFFNELLISRIFPLGADYKVEGEVDKNCFQVKIGQGLAGGDLGVCKTSYWWKLPTGFNTKMSLITAHSGLPFYRSYDFYVFMVTLMMCRGYFDSIVSREDIKGVVWDYLWLPKELEKVTNDVKKFHSIDKSPGLDEALKILSKYRMRCDAISLIVDLISEIEE